MQRHNAAKPALDLEEAHDRGQEVGGRGLHADGGGLPFAPAICVYLHEFSISTRTAAASTTDNDGIYKDGIYEGALSFNTAIVLLQ